MNNRQNWMVVAEECEVLAAAAKAQVNRDMLLAAAARWRRMARVARDLDEVTKLDQMGQPDLVLEPVSRHQR
jgi:hypothetical protein